MRQQFSQNVADILAFEGLSNLIQSHPDFIDGAIAVAAADIAQYGGSHLSTIESVFASREIHLKPSVVNGLEGDYFEPGHGGSKVHLEWLRNPLREGVDKYWLERSVEDEEFFTLSRSISDPGSGSIVTYDNWYPPDAEYLRYRVSAHNDFGWGSFCTPIIVELGEPLSSSIVESKPTKITLEPSYPNPSNLTTLIKFGLPTSSHVRLQIMNIRGQTVKVLVDEQKPAGWYTVTWDGKNEAGRDVASGIYLYLIEADNKKILKRMTIIR